MSGRPSGVGNRSMHGHGGGLQRNGGGGTIRRNGTLSRGKTLSRPDRFQTPETMFKKRKEDEPASCWVIFSRITTCWALPPFLKMCGMPDKQVQQAWREKFTLCFIIFLISGMVAFFTIGFPALLCPSSQRQGAHTFARYGNMEFEGKNWSHLLYRGESAIVKRVWVVRQHGWRLVHPHQLQNPAQPPPQGLGRT